MALAFIRDNISFVAISVTEHKLTKLKLITSTTTLRNHMYCKLDATHKTHVCFYEIGTIDLVVLVLFFGVPNWQH